MTYEPLQEIYIWNWKTNRIESAYVVQNHDNDVDVLSTGYFLRVPREWIYSQYDYIVQLALEVES